MVPVGVLLPQHRRRLGRFRRVRHRQPRWAGAYLIDGRRLAGLHVNRDDLGDSAAQAMRASRSASCSSAGSPDQARAPHRANRSSPDPVAQVRDCPLSVLKDLALVDVHAPRVLDDDSPVDDDRPDVGPRQRIDDGRGGLLPRRAVRTRHVSTVTSASRPGASTPASNPTNAAPPSAAVSRMVSLSITPGSPARIRCASTACFIASKGSWRWPTAGPSVPQPDDGAGFEHLRQRHGARSEVGVRHGIVRPLPRRSRPAQPLRRR